MKTPALIATAICLFAGSAAAEQYKTVSWFADRPDTTRGVLKLCRDNAAIAKHHPDCTNAEEAQSIIAEREAKYAGQVGSPLTREYWLQRPSERSKQLWICDSIDHQNVTPDAVTARMCMAARGG